VLRVGLTGGLGSGKSTAAAMFAAYGAHVFYADEIGRALMQPGEAVYAAIVEQFGRAVVKPDGALDRAALARIAFVDGRIEELNEIVHPATIARQAELIEAVAARDPNAVTMVESALIFQTKYGETKLAGWQKRFDRIIYVRASDELKVARFVERSVNGRVAALEERAALAADARRRMAQQAEGERNAERSDFVLTNDGTREKLQAQVDALWLELKSLANGVSGINLESGKR
jgi:dephospho-CoA kinase